jgi:peptidyl-prolyl cis-trans isomerase B (cyclophilin B)
MANFDTEVRNASNPLYEVTVKQGDNDFGSIILELWADLAPKHAANFEELVERKAFDGTAFHRVIPGFMIQGGDPNSISGPRNSWGMGDSKQKNVKAEFSKENHSRGILSAARSQDPNSASSQFFICVAEASFLNGQYSVYGNTVKGLDVVDKVVNSERDRGDNPLEKIEMTVKKYEA